MQSNERLERLTRFHREIRRSSLSGMPIIVSAAFLLLLPPWFALVDRSMTWAPNALFALIWIAKFARYSASTEWLAPASSATHYRLDWFMAAIGQTIAMGGVAGWLALTSQHATVATVQMIFAPFFGALAGGFVGVVFTWFATAEPSERAVEQIWRRIEAREKQQRARATVI